MKRFFYLCAALLCLSLAFHFGYTTARAQGAGSPVVALIGPSPQGPTVFAGAAITASGDVYSTNISALDHGWIFRANIFNGGATPALQESWGQLKSRYRTTPPATPGMTARPGASDR